MFYGNVCIIRPKREEEITNAEKKRECANVSKNKSCSGCVRELFNRIESESYSALRRVTLWKNFTQFPVSVWRKKKKKEKLVVANFSIEIENLRVYNLFQIKFPRYLFWKRSNFHNKKKKKKTQILSIKIFIKFRRFDVSPVDNTHPIRVAANSNNPVLPLEHLHNPKEDPRIG